MQSLSMYETFPSYWHPIRKVTMIVELCADLSLTVGPHFALPKPTFSIAKMRSTIMKTEAVDLGNQSVRDRRIIARAVIIITERTGSS